MKICFIDTETTGLDSKRHGIIQIAAIMEIDGVEAGRFETFLRPASTCACDAKALEISGHTVEEIRGFKPEPDAFRDFMDFLGAHVSKFDKTDKAIFSGYNAPFDNEFVRQLFERNGDKFFGSWFWSGTVDVMGLALLKLADQRAGMENFKLGTVASHVLGFHRVQELSEANGLHNAMTDIEITRENFRAERA